MRIVNQIKKFNYNFNSNKKPLIVFIHGAGCDQTLWSNQNRYYYNKGFSTVAINLPGHGKNNDKALTTVKGMANYITNVLKETVHKKFILISHSMGTLISIYLAFNKILNITKMILIGSSLPMKVSSYLLEISRKDQAFAINNMINWSLPGSSGLYGSQIIGMRLQNYLFKEAGGIKTSCFQKSLCILPLSCFVYSDIFFSLGEEQGKICNDLGGEIKLFKPVGSFFIESTWLKQKKDLEKIPDIDVLIIGMNVPWQYSTAAEDFKNSYYNKFIPWIKKISEDFPDKKIFYKHHSNFIGDTKEKNLLSQTNVKIIINDDSINSTYAWAFKSKINLSFGSTMILELNGNGKEAFFIDPDGLNHQWFHGIKDLEKYRIQNYESLKEVVENCNIEKNNSSSQNNSFLCLKSDNTSKVIAEILKEAKIKN